MVLDLVADLDPAAAVAVLDLDLADEVVLVAKVAMMMVAVKVDLAVVEVLAEEAVLVEEVVLAAKMTMMAAVKAVSAAVVDLEVAVAVIVAAEVAAAAVVEVSSI